MVIIKIYLAISVLAYALSLSAANRYVELFLADDGYSYSFSPFALSSLRLLIFSFIPILNMALLYLIVFDADKVFLETKRHLED